MLQPALKPSVGAASAGCRSIHNWEFTISNVRSCGDMIERRKSRIQGWGVFATQPINKNTRIVTYDGEKITNRESLKREATSLEKCHIWCFILNQLFVCDEADGSIVALHVN